MKADLIEIAKRLRAYRIGSGLSADDVAAKLHVSRAAVYRFEKYGINQIETLERVAKLLNVSVASLLGCAVEYTSNITAYLERYRQIEETADWLFVLFGPISYVLTSDEYDRGLRSALLQETSRKLSFRQVEPFVNSIMSVLAKRKTTFRRRKPRITNVISADDIVRFAKFEFAFSDSLKDEQRLLIAHRELERIATLLKKPPLGVQLGVVFERLPTTSFSIGRDRDKSTVLISPFRLGPDLNARAGVAMITSAAEAVKLHEDVGARLWEEAITGEKAAQFVRAQITRS